jgi:hypothetical protein
MAKKRATGKRRGLDDYGQPVDLSKDAGRSYERAKESASRLADELSKIRKPTSADRFEYMSDIKRNARNASDILRNKTTEKSPAGFGSRRTKISQAIQLPAAKTNPLAGRTVEFGTRSMLQGLRSWIAGGGGSRLTGR